jgi:hypothetical protein
MQPAKITFQILRSVEARIVNGAAMATPHAVILGRGHPPPQTNPLLGYINRSV